MVIGVIKDYQSIEKDGVVLGYRMILPSLDETPHGVTPSIRWVTALRAYRVALEGDIIDSINSDGMITFGDGGKPIKLDLSHLKNEDNTSSTSCFKFRFVKSRESLLSFFRVEFPGNSSFSVVALLFPCCNFIG